MDTRIILNQVSVLFLIMIIGFIANKLKILTRNTCKNLSELLLNIILPCLIISSFQFKFSTEMLKNAAIVFVIAFSIHLITAIASHFIYKKFDKKKQPVLSFITVFSNCAYMGFPVIEKLYQKTGLFYASIYVICFNIFLYTYGVFLFDKDKKISFKHAILNPGVIAVLIGFSCFLFSFSIPMPFSKVFDMVGSMTTPVSMMIIGSLMAEANYRTIFKKGIVYYGCFVRLILLPIITYIILSSLGICGIMLSVCVLVTAMPIATAAAIFTEKYNGDSILASTFVVVSTLFSIVTLPIMIFISG
jgi:malate permease and related proteins